MRFLLFWAMVGRALAAEEAIDTAVNNTLQSTGAKGLAVAVIEEGKVRYVRAFGVRNAKGEPLTTDTVMYGASLTKTVFAYTVMQLVDAGKFDLDRSLGAYLSKPLPEYGPYKALAGDARWEKITARMALTHSTGFANFWFIEPDRQLRIHFEPGSRYAYSGEGLILLQFVMERGLGLDLGEVTQSAFRRLGMPRSSFVWRKDFAANLADGWNDRGEAQPHDERSKVRAAGSMDTTIADMVKFAAALVRGEGLSKKARAEMTKPQVAITTAHQFPPFAPELPAEQRRKDLAAGLGVVVFDGPQGHGFFKGATTAKQRTR